MGELVFMICEPPVCVRVGIYDLRASSLWESCVSRRWLSITRRFLKKITRTLDDVGFIFVIKVNILTL